MWYSKTKQAVRNNTLAEHTNKSIICLANGTYLKINIENKIILINHKSIDIKYHYNVLWN